ncbi:MAG: calcium-binding protein, partial [Pseudomonadota bacterium]|nr:calcium-binding protein [Pseudomonadota bacterium]
QNDTVSYAEVTSDALTVTLNYDATTTVSFGAETDTLTLIDHIVGTNYTAGTGDIINGDEIGNRIYLQDGDDYADGNGGNDIIDARVELGEILAKDQSLVYLADTNTVYKVVDTQLTWTAAEAAAIANVLAGSGESGLYTPSDVAGRLVTAESGTETRVVYGQLGTNGTNYWMGGVYNSGESAWEWTGGPLDGVNFYEGGGYITGGYDVFSQPTGSTTALDEPDGRAGQTYLLMNTGGWWVTADNVGEANTSATPYTGGRGYIIEWDAAAFANAGTNNDNTIYGGTGDDTIYADAGDDTLYGDSGADVILGGAGSDTIYGGAEDDTIYLSSDGVADTYDAGTGSDTLNALQLTTGIDINLDDAGNQTITDFGGGTTNIGADVISGFQNVKGSNFDDLIQGDALNNSLRGNDGDDTVYGHDGNDYLEDGYGADTIYGGDGDDVIVLYGDNDSDIVYAGIDQTTDNDTGDELRFNKLGGDVVINLMTNTVTSNKGYVDYIYGIENITLNDDTGDDTVYGNAASNTITGADNNDYINGGAGEDWLYGHDESGGLSVDPGHAAGREGNWLDYLNEGGSFGVTVTLDGSNESLATDTYGDTDHIFYFQHVRGTNEADTITGDQYNNLLNGNDGADILDGATGDDQINGGAGNDTIYSGAGDDTVVGGDDDDSIYGDAGQDTLNGDAGNDYIEGGGDADEIYGDDGDDTIYGDDGADLIDGGLGADLIYGGLGDDFINGGDHADTIYGGDGNDNITLYFGGGTASADTVYGEAGDDYISMFNNDNANDYVDGGAGIDTLYVRQNTTTTGTVIDLTNGTMTSQANVDTILGFENVYTGFTNSVAEVIGSDQVNVITAQSGSIGVKMAGMEGDDTLDGDDTSSGLASTEDWASHEYDTAGVTVNLQAGTAIDGWGGNDVLIGIENIIGSAYGDTLTGDANGNTIDAGDGNDFIYAKGANSADNDVIIGGDGTDTAYLLDVTSINTITLDLTTGDYDIDTITPGSVIAADGNISEVEIIYTARGDDYITGSTGADTLFTSDGNDILNLGTGDDFV